MKYEQKIKAMCLLIQDGFVLVGDGNSVTSSVRKVVSGNFYRVLGGHLEKNETPENAVRREIKEEVGMEIDNLEFLETFENNFTYAGEENHELVSLFKGELNVKNIDKSKVIHKIEDTYEFDILWIPISQILAGEKVLKPDLDYSRFLSK